MLFLTKNSECRAEGITLGCPLPKRPVVSAAKFGAWLEMRRGAHRSLAQIAQKVRPYVKEAGLKVDPSVLYKIEKGRVPNWPLLAALAKVYGISIVDMTRVLIASLEFPGVKALLDQADQPIEPVLLDRIKEEDLQVARDFHDAPTWMRQQIIGLLEEEEPDRLTRIIQKLRTMPERWWPVIEALVDDANQGREPPAKTAPTKKP